MKTVTFQEPRQLDKTHLIQLYKYWLCLYIGNELATYQSGPFNYHFGCFFFFFSGPQDHETHSQDTGAAGLRSNFLTPSKTPVR